MDVFKEKKIKYIEAIICCVNFSDYLSETLFFNYKFFDHVIILTIPEDKKTIDLCNIYKNITCIKTNLFYKGGGNFNRGAVTNLAFKNLRYNDWVVIFDLDIILMNNFLNIIKNKNLYTNIIYGLPRVTCNYKHWYLDQWKKFGYSLEACKEPQICWGFFQMFHIKSDWKNNKEKYPEHIKTLGQAEDYFFAKQFRKKILLSNQPVCHIHQKNYISDDYSGRKSPKFKKNTFLRKKKSKIEYEQYKSMKKKNL